MSRRTIQTKVFAACLALVFIATALSVLTINAQAIPNEMVAGVGSIPVAKVGPAAFVTDDGTLFVIGGGSSMGSPSNTVQRYGLENKTTSYGTPMPSGRWAPIYTMGIDGNMYLFGGFNGGYYSDVQIYNSLNNTWWTRSAPSAYGVGTAVTLTNGSIVIFNGAWSTKTTMYNPTTNTWYTMTPTPSGLDGQRSAVLINDTAILVMGGGDGGSTTSAICEIYNPVADSWATVASLPLDSAFGGAVMGNDGLIYYIGGFYGGGWPPPNARNEIQRYDIEEDSWTVVSSTISPAKSLFGTAQDQYGRTFIVAGVDASDVALDDIDMILTQDLVETNNVLITSPGAGSVVSDTISVSAMMTSKTSGVDPMLAEFYVDGGFVDNALGSSTIRSWTFMWDTTGLTDGSTHTLMVRVYLDNANITQDSITVVVSVNSVSDKISDLKNQITQLENDLNQLNVSDSQKLSDLKDALDAQIADLKDALDEMNASSSQYLTVLQGQLTTLQNQLNALQTETGATKDSASSANMFAMIGMLVAIIVLVLVIISLMMSRSKK